MKELDFSDGTSFSRMKGEGELKAEEFFPEQAEDERRLEGGEYQRRFVDINEVPRLRSNNIMAHCHMPAKLAGQRRKKLK